MHNQTPKARRFASRAIQKVIAWTLALATVFTVTTTNVTQASAEAADYEATQVVQVSTVNAPIRKSASKNSHTLYRCESGDFLTVVDEKVNISKNLWYQVQFFENGETKTGWIYAGNVSCHDHAYNQVGTSQLHLCDCGAYELRNTNAGTTLTSAGVAVLGGMLPLGVAAELAATELAALGGAVVGLMPAAIAGLALAVVVGGVVYLVVTNERATRIVDVMELSSEADFIANTDDEKYYAAYAYKNNLGDCIVAMAPSGMDIDEATKYIQAATAFNYGMVSDQLLYQSGSNNKILNGIWCSTEAAATQLAKKVEQNVAYSYGSSKGANHKCELNKSDMCYWHYHIHSTLNSAVFKKAWGIHIFFGMNHNISVSCASF